MILSTVVAEKTLAGGNGNDTFGGIDDDTLRGGGLVDGRKRR